MEEIRIAHLSDLHCNSKDQWQNMFSYILMCLERILPNIIIISGDLVHTPTKRNFETLKTHINMIKDNRTLPDNLHILVVPGNHDYFLYGNNFFNFFNRKNLYEKFEKDYLYPFSNKKELVTSIFKTFNIGIFPLDSNEGKYSFGFARGKVLNSLVYLQQLSEHFKKKSTDAGILWESVLKIAVLHHHPVPIATPSTKQSIDRFLVFRNSYEFLESCRSCGVNMIFHGHRHMSNLINYRFFRDNSKPLTISSCASTGSYDAERREIKLIKISRQGTIKIQSHYSRMHDHDFVSEENFHETTYYGDIRKTRNQLFLSNGSVNKRTISSIRNKTKIITILNDGFAYVNVSLSNIKWGKNVDRKKKNVQERIRSDLGRVVGGMYEFSKCPITGEGLEEKWENPKLSQGTLPDPEKPEAFIMTFYPSNPINTEDEDCLKLSYFMSSGFSLTKREHEERYRRKTDLPIEEYACISVDCPTYLLELIVRFDDLDFFPPVKGIYIVASQKEDIEQNQDLKQLYGEVPSDREESEFIFKKGALRIRPETREIAVIIKYPQPGIEYCLRWNLPDYDKREIDRDQNKINLNKKLCMRIFDQRYNENIEYIYKTICDFINTEIFQDDIYHSFLLGFNYKNKFLEIVKFPDQFINNIVGRIIPGRGPAGKSFKLRKAIFWERGTGGILSTFGLPDYPVEEVIAGFRPIKVFAMPLILPSYISEEGVVGDEKKYICPAWGCLSLASEKENSFINLSQLDQKERSEKLTEIFKKINIQLRKCLNDTFSDIFFM